MIPTAILVGLALGPWLRWWAAPVTGALWAIVIGVGDGGIDDVPAALALGTANGLLGAALTVGVLHLVDRRRHRATAA
jgi:hypothetical protein